MLKSSDSRGTRIFWLISEDAKPSSSQTFERIVQNDLKQARKRVGKNTVFYKWKLFMSDCDTNPVYGSKRILPKLTIQKSSLK